MDEAVWTDLDTATPSEVSNKEGVPPAFCTSDVPCERGKTHHG